MFSPAIKSVLFSGNFIASTTTTAAGAWYYSAGEDSYSTYGVCSSGYAVGADIGIGQNGNVTKLAFKLANASTALAKIAIYSTNSTLANSGAEISAGMSSGWNETTIASFAVLSGNTIRVLIDVSTNVILNYNSSGNGFYLASNYASFPESSYTLNVDTGKINAVRAYVE